MTVVLWMQVARLAGIPHEVINVAQQAGMKLEEKLQVCIAAYLKSCTGVHPDSFVEPFYTDLSIHGSTSLCNYLQGAFSKKLRMPLRTEEVQCLHDIVRASSTGPFEKLVEAWMGRGKDTF